MNRDGSAFNKEYNKEYWERDDYTDVVSDDISGEEGGERRRVHSHDDRDKGGDDERRREQVYDGDDKSHFGELNPTEIDKRYPKLHRERSDKGRYSSDDTDTLDVGSDDISGDSDDESSSSWPDRDNNKHLMQKLRRLLLDMGISDVARGEGGPRVGSGGTPAATGARELVVYSDSVGRSIVNGATNGIGENSDGELDENKNKTTVITEGDKLANNSIDSTPRKLKS